ncbi:MAG: anti-CBASS protein Acb1 family protein, partial [Nitrospirales bacterium]
MALIDFRAAASALLQRYQFAKAAGMSFGGKRNTWMTLGYPEMGNLTTRDFLDRYERGGIAGRVVDVLPDGTWRGEMWLQEDEDPDKDTPFELAWTEMEKRLAIRQRLHQTDVLARLSTYSVLLLGTADGNMDKELPKGKPEQLLYLQPYLGSGGPAPGRGRGQAQSGGFDADVTIQEYDLDTKSPRFAMPLFYSLRRSDIAVEMFQRPIHWSRVIHAAEGTLRDDVFGRPALERVWNYLEDLDKVVGGGSEAFWLRSNAGIHLNVDPTMTLNANATEELKKLQEQAEEYQHQLTRMIRTRGVEVSQLGSDVANFQSPADVIITILAGAIGVPKRLLVGSERGELASTQDRENFRDLINGRQTNYAAPKIVRPLVDRLIEYGYLPTPKEYKVMWPTIEVMSETEKASGATGWAGVNSSMQKTVFTDDEIRDKWAGLKPLSEEQKAAIEEESAKKFEEQKELVATKKPDVVAKAGPKPVARAAEEALEHQSSSDDELVRVLEMALETGADEVVAAIVGLGGPNSGRYKKGSGQNPQSGSSSGSPGPSDAQMQSVAASMKNTIQDALNRERRDRNQWWGDDSDSFNPVEKLGYGQEGYGFGVRDFGSWRVPLDAEGDASAGDFEDYDWEEPTPETAARVDKLVKMHADRNPNMEVTWSAEEKNWISFAVRPKKLKTLKGTSSSGNHGHAGRKGHVGGSAKGVTAGFVKATKAQQKALGLPPAWTGVLINPDPKGKLVAIGYDAAGRRQPRYSEEHHREKAASKHGRVSAFGKSLPGLRKQIDKDHETSDEAVILDLIDKTSFRKGSDRDTKAKVKAYGTSTLLEEHVKIRGNDVHFDFIAKE